MRAGPAARAQAAAALAAIPGMEGAAIVGPLAAGPTNATWLVEQDARHWVLRLDMPEIGSLGLDRESERQVCTAAAAAGITPEYRCFDPAAGIYLRRYVPGRALSGDDLGYPRTLDRLAAVLRTLHALPLAGRAFDPAAAVRRYAAQLGSRAASELAGRALASLEGPAAGEGRFATCHNDLVAENVLQTAAGDLLLIDWEYAGVGDPMFDLAVVIRHHGLREPLARGFLEAYLQRPAAAAENERLTRLCVFYGYLLELWNLRVGDPNRS